MDGQQFDRVIQGFGQALSRRRFGAVLAGLLAPYLPQDAAGKRGRDRKRGAHNRKRKQRSQGRTQAEAACFTGSPCTPGPGKNLGKCDFGGSPALKNKNLTGANLGAANLRGADASGANLKGANLNKACLIDANLTGAKINGSTNTGGAIFCRTTMPDGNTNDAGCNRGTTCCPTCIRDGHTCGGGITGSCCAGTVCLGGVCATCDVCLNGCPFDNLADAIAAADEGDTIRICPGTYRTIDVLIEKDLTIIGAGDGADGTILDGDLQAGVLEINSNSTVTIGDLTVTRGSVPSFGGGGILVRNASTLTLERVQVTHSRSTAGGGGIFVAEGSTLNLRLSAVTDNTATGNASGGGIYNFSGTVTLDASRVAGNVAGQNGGGIINDFDDTLILTNGSQVTGNRAQSGGGVYNLSQVTVSGGSAITGNTPDNCVNSVTGTGCPA